MAVLSRRVAGGVLIASVAVGVLAIARANASASAIALESDAYGVSTFATVIGSGPIEVGPIPSTRLYQPGMGSPQTAAAATVGPIPSTGEALVQYATAL